MGMKFVGVDGCKGGWFAVTAFSDGEVDCKCFQQFSDLWEEHSDAQAILVDIPIGLPWREHPVRAADQEARAFMKRGSSVFSAPLRKVVHAPSVNEMWMINKRDGGKLTPFGKALIPKIREVDELLCDTSKNGDIVYESHPEVCFAAMKRTALNYRKKTYAGMLERIRLLESYYKNVGEMMDAIYTEYTKSTVAPDDILDALVLAVTARESRGNPVSLPAVPPRDQLGLPMAIWYHDFN